MKTIDEIIDDILKKEGGYVNDPKDRGGATNYGITIVTLSKWLGRKATISEVKNLDISVAREIFKSRYYYKPRIDLLPNEFQHIVFDMSVNHGQSKGSKLFQLALKTLGYDITVDGFIGLRTKALAEKALKEHSLKEIINTIVEIRNSFYISIVNHNSSQKRFLKGWLNRSNSFKM